MGKWMTKWQSSKSHFKTKIASVHEPWHTQGPLSWDLSAWYVRLSIFCIKSLDEAKFSLSGPPKKFFSNLTFSLSIIVLLMGGKMACFTHNFVGNKGRNVTWNLSGPNSPCRVKNWVQYVTTNLLEIVLRAIMKVNKHGALQVLCPKLMMHQVCILQP